MPEREDYRGDGRRTLPGLISLAILASLIAAAVVALIGFMLTLFGAMCRRAIAPSIEKHYAKASGIADEFDELLNDNSATKTGDLPGTLPSDEDPRKSPRKRKPPRPSGLLRERATGVEPATSSLGSEESAFPQDSENAEKMQIGQRLGWPIRVPKRPGESRAKPEKPGTVPTQEGWAAKAKAWDSRPAGRA